MKLVNPCPTVPIILSPTPFIDSNVFRKTETSQDWNKNEIATSSTLIDCGPMSLVFFNDDAEKSDLDPSIFFDD